MYEDEVEEIVGGSPAQAGIDPGLPGRGAVRRWFPRTGGDRPVVDAPVEVAEPVPPHRRG